MEISKLKTSREREQELEVLSPFELKDNLISLASGGNICSIKTMLNAGRGNPNWIATIPREAFFTLGLFGIEECRRQMDKQEGMAGIPVKEGIGERFEDFLKKNSDKPGIELLEKVYRHGLEKHSFDADTWAMEMAEGVIGDQYPTPDRMLSCCEKMVHEYVVREMCGDNPKNKGRYDLFATEGGTAAMCYVFDSLLENGLLKKGDKIALGVPIFTPYLEIPELDRYEFEVIHIEGAGTDKNGNLNFQYTNEELDKLADTSVKAFFIINPSNPTSVEISDESRKYIVDIVTNKNPNLMILTDDVYGTFVNGFTSLMNDLPRNTICVYSFSKYFGATGWRLGVIALYEDNIYDEMLAKQSDEQKKKLTKLYSSLTIHPESLKFIDRMVADSRQVALNHTAGLSLPQQIQMMLFAGFATLDKENNYKKVCIELIQNRFNLLWEGLKIPFFPDKYRAGYYSEIDIRDWAVKNYGAEFVDYLQKNFEPVDIVFRLAERNCIVLLNGGGFAGPEWSVRVSLANLNDGDYSVIGKKLRDTMQEYLSAWENSKKQDNKK